MSDRRSCCCNTTYCCTPLNYSYNYALFDSLLEKYENIETDPLLPPNYQWVVKAKGLDGRDDLILHMPACEGGGWLTVSCPVSPPPCEPPLNKVAFGKLDRGTTRNNPIRVRYKHLKCYWIWFGKPYSFNFDPNIPFCTATSTNSGDPQADCFVECFLNQYGFPCKCPTCCQLGEQEPSVGARKWIPRWVPFLPAMTENERLCCASSFGYMPEECTEFYMSRCQDVDYDDGFCDSVFTPGDGCKTCNLSPYLRRISQDDHPWAFDIYCYANNVERDFGVHYLWDGTKTADPVKLQDIFLGFAFVEHQYQQIDVRFEDLNSLPRIVEGEFGPEPSPTLAAVTPEQKRDSWFYFNQRCTPNMFAYSGAGTPIFHFDVYFAERAGIFDRIEDPATGGKLTPIEFIRRFENAGCTYRLYGQGNPAATPGFQTLTCGNFEDYYAPLQVALEYMMEAGIVGTTDSRLDIRQEIYEILTSIQEDGSSYFTPWARNPDFRITVSADDVAKIKQRIGYSTWSGPSDIFDKTPAQMGLDAHAYAPCRKMLLAHSLGGTEVQPRFNPGDFPHNTSASMVSQNQTANRQVTTSANYQTQAAYFGMQGFFRAQVGGWNFYKTIDGCGEFCGGGEDPCSRLLLSNYNADRPADDPIVYDNAITGFLERNWLAKDFYTRSYRAPCSTLSLLPPYNGQEYANSSVGGGEDPCISNQDWVWIANGIPSLRTCVNLGNVAIRCLTCFNGTGSCSSQGGCNPPSEGFCVLAPQASCDDFCGHVGFYGNEEIFVNSFSNYAPMSVFWDCDDTEIDGDEIPDGQICAHSLTCYSFVAFAVRYAEIASDNGFLTYQLLDTPWTPPPGYLYNVLAPLHRVPTQTNKALCGLRCGCVIGSGNAVGVSAIAGPGGVGVCGWCNEVRTETPPFYVVGGPTTLALSDNYADWNF